MSPDNCTIPAFDAAGVRRRRNYSPESAAHLVALSRAAAKRDRHGHIRSIHFRDPDGGSPLRGVATLGQRYSYLAQIGESARIWQHKKLETGPLEFAAVVVCACVRA